MTKPITKRTKLEPGDVVVEKQTGRIFHVRSLHDGSVYLIAAFSVSWSALRRDFVEPTYDQQGNLISERG